MNRLDEYGYAGLYKALKHKYKYALSTNLPCVSRHSQFLALLCIFPELISLQESCGSRFRLISRLFGCLRCLLLLTVRHIPEIRNDHPSLVVKVAKSFCKNTKYCSAILSAIFLRSVMTTHSHSPPPLNHAPAIFDELQTSLCFPFPWCK